MPDQPAGRIAVIPHDRIARATQERIRGPVPALSIPVEGANQVRDKPGVTLNRAGTNPRNPILKGLGHRITTILGQGVTLKAVYIYQRAAALGRSLLGITNNTAPGAHFIDVVAGAGSTQSGSPATGSVKNFIRFVTNRGVIEKEFWIKSQDYDVVALNGTPALDSVTLLKVCKDVAQIETASPWLDVTIDYMVSWNDEFQALHRSGNPNIEPGFLKSYGGALFVSLFDTSTATEGVGVQVNPVTQAEVKDQHVVQVQNTAGIKNFTVRFRSAKDSPFFVDIDVCVNVLVLVCDPGDPPVDGPPPGPPPAPPTLDYLPPQDPPITPTDIPCSDLGGGEIVPYSVVGITPSTWTDPVTVSIDVLTFQAQSIAAPEFVVRRYSVVTDPLAAVGFQYTFLNQKKYTPLIVSGATKPTEGAPYPAAQAYRIAFSHAQEVLDNVMLYEVYLKDGDLYSQPAAFPGPGTLALGAFISAGSGRPDTTPPT